MRRENTAWKSSQVAQEWCSIRDEWKNCCTVFTDEVRDHKLVMVPINMAHKCLLNWMRSWLLSHESVLTEVLEGLGDPETLRWGEEGRHREAWLARMTSRGLHGNPVGAAQQWFQQQSRSNLFPHPRQGSQVVFPKTQWSQHLSPKVWDGKRKAIPWVFWKLEAKTLTLDGCHLVPER